MLWKMQPTDELEDKGHDENQSQLKYFIFISIIIKDVVENGML